MTLPTVVKTRRRLADGGLEAALGELPRPGQRPKLDAKQAARITALACSKAPDGHDHWTLRLLGAKIVELGFAQSYSPEGVRQLLKKTNSSLGRSSSGALPRSTKSSSPAWSRELETYLLPLDEQHPVVCFDESPFQLLQQVREPLAAAPGRPRREDYEYERRGVAEVMMICQPAVGLRKCLVREHRKKADFAAVCREVDAMFPAAQKITLVCDNLNTHTLGALYATFPAEQARRLAKKIEIMHTPKHGS